MALLTKSRHLFPRRQHFSCHPPLSVRDDYGNCIDFVNEKWVLQGPKALLLTGFIVSVLAGCWTLVFFGSEGRARKRLSCSNTEGWFKKHSIQAAMAFALCYFIVDAYLRFLQFQQQSLKISNILFDLARTKPKGAGDYIVLTVILFNDNIHTINGTHNQKSFKACRRIFMVFFTLSDLASAIGDVYTKAILAIDIGTKGGSVTYLEVIPHYVTTILTSFDTVAFGLICLAGIYFITVALKSKARDHNKISKQYFRYFTIAAVAFFIRSIPGLVLCIISEWFSWTKTYGMNLLDNTIYAVTTCMIFYFWTRLAKTPINVDGPEQENEDTGFLRGEPQQLGMDGNVRDHDPLFGLKQPKYVQVAVSPVDGRHF